MTRSAFFSISEVLLMTVQKSSIKSLAALVLPKPLRDLQPPFNWSVIRLKEKLR
jgi:hypothetical protein